MDRVIYAVIGATFGAILGVVCWFLYGLAFSRNFSGMSLNVHALPWVKVFAGTFAALGFLFKDRVGTIVGNTVAGLFTAEGDRDYGPNLSVRHAILAVAAVAGIVWYLVTH
ncbi:MAG: hypothetical protein ACOZDY_03040 [Pseudomonadota bacterium]|jgi:hypothetical protein